MKVREDRGSCWPRPFFKKADVNEGIDAERTRGPLLSYLHALSLKFCLLLCVHERTHCVGAASVSMFFVLFCFFSDVRELYMYLPAHHYAGLVIKTIIQSHWLTHMFVKVQLSVIAFLQQGKKREHGVWIDAD